MGPFSGLIYAVRGVQPRVPVCSTVVDGKPRAIRQQYADGVKFPAVDREEIAQRSKLHVHHDERGTAAMTAAVTQRIAIARKRLAELRKEFIVTETDVKIDGESAEYARLVFAQIASYAKSSAEQHRILEYALNSKLPPEEVLYEDREKKLVWRRQDFIEFVGRVGVFDVVSDLYIDHINKSSLKANDGYFKKFIFRNTFATLKIREGDGRRENYDYANDLIQVRNAISNMPYVPEGKIDANKCELWCIPISYQRHGRVMVINVKEACFEYLDSECADCALLLMEMGNLPARIVEPVTRYINSLRRHDDAIDFSKFELRFPRVPCQPVGSKACAIYRLGFLEEWDGGGADLRRFEGWDEESWHVKERVKICAFLLTDHDSNVVADEVEHRAREWHTYG